MHNATLAVTIAIPARNEAERIGACLAALAGQVGVAPFGVVVLANNCADETEVAARAWRQHLPALEVLSVVLPAECAHAGQARRLAMARAAELSAADGVLMTTDADAVPPANWVAANLAALRGVEAVAGRAVIDPVEAALIPRHLHDLDARECAYAALLDEIAWLLAPQPHDPWPRHDEHSGASIAVRRKAYMRAGGIPGQACGEDRQFFEALRQTGARIRHAPEVFVMVSGRLQGRAAGGMADTIRARIAQAPDYLDDRLEPADDLLRRLTAPGPHPARRMVAHAELAHHTARARAMRDRLRNGLEFHPYRNEARAAE